MDGLLVFTIIVFAVTALAALSAAFGAETRDGFANDRLRSSLS